MLSNQLSIDIALKARYEQLRARNLDLDLTRGNPSKEQLDLSLPMLEDTSYISRDGVDCRNYGPPEYLGGLPEARELFGQYLGVSAENTWVLDNSSLRIIHDVFVQAWFRGVSDDAEWQGIKFLLPHRRNAMMLCPTPLYDRHLEIGYRYGIDLVSIPMNDDGLDMDQVETAAKYSNCVGIWCVPKYSNPSGITYSQEVCERLARMQTAVHGFRIFWDLAYQEHHLTEMPDELPNMLEMCRATGNANRVFIFGSTSKITFAGAGLALFAASERNLAWCREWMSKQSIGPNKLNQLHHVRFLRDLDGIRAHMAKHRAILKPKFDVVDEILTRELGEKGIAHWGKPRGGYFTSLWVKPGCAQRAVALAGKIGVKFTSVRAAFPYGDIGYAVIHGVEPHDPNYDSHIRIAPTFPPIEELRQAIEALAVCVQIAALESAK